MSVFTDLLHRVEADVEGIFADSEKAVASFFSTLLTEAEKSLPQLMLDTVTNAVAAAEAAGGSGSDKFAAAEASVISTAKSEGIAIATTVVHASIEAAVATLRANSPMAQATAALAPVPAPTVGQGPAPEPSSGNVSADAPQAGN